MIFSCFHQNQVQDHILNSMEMFFPMKQNLLSPKQLYFFWHWLTLPKSWKWYQLMCMYVLSTFFWMSTHKTSSKGLYCGRFNTVCFCNVFNDSSWLWTTEPPTTPSWEMLGDVAGWNFYQRKLQNCVPKMLTDSSHFCPDFSSRFKRNHSQSQRLLKSSKSKQ